MKKNGIINPELAYALADLGHMDSFVICDMGFPIPEGVKKIDLTLTAGIPEFMPVLKACLNEVAVQHIALMEGVKTDNKKLNDEINSMRHNQDIEYMSFDDFREKVRNARFFIRTGETKPCSNIYLTSASGVLERVEKYDISFI